MNETLTKTIETEKTKKIGVLIGGGSRLPAIYDYTQKPSSNAEISVVASHKKDSPGLVWAQEHNLHNASWNRVQMQIASGRPLDEYREEYERNLAYWLKQSPYKPDLIVMVGWDLVMGPAFLNEFKHADSDVPRVINLHPALLPDDDSDTFTTESGIAIPAFRGEDCIRKAFETNSPYTGITVHFATPTFDVGPVILRREVPITKGQTLEEVEKTVHDLENIAIVDAIDFCLTQKYRFEGNIILPVHE